MLFKLKAPSEKLEPVLRWGVEIDGETVYLTVAEENGNDWYVFAVRQKDGVGFLCSDLPVSLGLSLDKEKRLTVNNKLLEE